MLQRRSERRLEREMRTVAKPDFVDEIVAERSLGNPDFPELVEAALRTRRLVRELTERRRAMGISQTVVAARMGTSQSALARLESGGSDPRLSTLERYARALGDEAGAARPSRS
jgi:ribosome-binding protein aMBF1 (putative translation factor)